MKFSLLALLVLLPFLLLAQTDKSADQETAMGFSKAVDLNFEQA